MYGLTNFCFFDRLSGSKEDVGLDYAKALFDAIVRPLSQEGSEGTEKSLDVMREYSLLREDLDSLSQLSDWNFRPDPFARLESKVINLCFLQTNFYLDILMFNVI